MLDQKVHKTSSAKKNLLEAFWNASTCAEELYGHRVLQRSTRTVKAGIYLLWQYKVCWTPETSDVVHGRVAKRVVDCLRRNEGLYVKFGQAMSTMET